MPRLTYQTAGLTLTLVLVALASAESRAQPSIDLAGVFSAAGTEGAFVAIDADGTVLHVHNPARANQPLSPASTFKIANTLIGLQRGFVDVRDTRFRWDGVDRGVAAWNQHHTLRSAFQASCVWCYQDLARRIGRDAYLADLAAIEYGNRQIGDAVDQFWLDGSLRISALDQARFLSLLWQGLQPFRRDVVADLKTVMQVERNDSYTLYAKSGWTGASLGVGWYVGVVETSDQTVAFALNLPMTRAEEAPLRKRLAMASLTELGVLR
ncbi:MAG: class D beta-lactamase [Pseudomonadota bacterium]